MIVTSRYILTHIAWLTLDYADLKQTLNKKRLRKISTVHTLVKNTVIIAKTGSSHKKFASVVTYVV